MASLFGCFISFKTPYCPEKDHFLSLKRVFKGRLLKNQALVRLTSTEYNLLGLLVRNQGKVLTHHYLLRAIWGPGFINQSQYLSVFIAQIRKKIKDDPNNPQYLLTESGLGYGVS